jgi:tRNA(Ile)-lysidine synthase
MIEKNDHVVVGCSGGADSVCLLLVLHACRSRLGFPLTAVHVEHGIRGEESRQDAVFTEELCRRLAVPVVVCPVDAPAYAAAHKMGIEEAARTLRYEAFEKVAAGLRGDGADCAQTAGRQGTSVQPADRVGTVKLALAHHMEDNAETLLFQLARGSGLAGLCGIPPVRQEEDICYIRPLLCVTRAEIEAYLADCGQPYCTDRTNLDETYTRNRIRKHVLPQLSAVNAQAVQHMNQSAEKISGAYDFIREFAEIKYRELLVRLPEADEPAAKEQTAEAQQPGDQKHIALRASGLLAQHPAVMQEVLRMALFAAAGHRKDISAVHVEELAGLLKLQSGRRISLPYGLTAFMEYDALHISPDGGEAPEVQTFPVTADTLRNCAVMHHSGAEALPTAREAAPWCVLWEDGHGAGLRARVWETAAPLEEITKKAYTKQFDYDKIKNGFFVRKRQTGDYFVLDWNGHKKKLSDYMVNEKIPARLRDCMPLLAQESEVIWLIGGRISATCRVTEDTTRIMEIEYNGGVSDGL